MSLFNSIWGIIAYPLGFIMQYCYIFADSVLHLPIAYVFAMLFFTIVTKVLMFPLSLKQQRSTVMMAAYKPMIDEIQKKYANNKEKMNEEMMKLQQEYGYSPTAGCLPLLIQFPILFGLIEVIYKPLTYMIRIPAAIITALTEAVPEAASAVAASASNRLVENMIIQGVKSNPSAFTNLAVEGVSADVVSANISKIAELNMSIGPIDLWVVPKFEWSWMLIIPLFSILTMLLSSFISMRASGSAQGGSAAITTIAMSVMFAWISFIYPSGLSLYWGLQNIVSIGQSFLLKKIINVDKYRAQIEAQIAEKKRQKKEKKKIAVKDEATGTVQQLEISGDELARLRMQKAREIDEKRYSAVSEEEKEAPAEPSK